MRIRTLSFLFTMLILTACQQKNEPADGFRVTGNIQGLGNTKILVINFVNGGMELDSIIPENDSFTYTGNVKEPYFIQMLLKTSDSTSSKLTEFMIENSEISISGNSVDYDSITVSGSEADRVLKAYFQEDEILSNKWNTLKEEYDEAVQLNDSSRRKTLGKELNKIFKGDRVDLLKRYVSDHSNSTVGALLPAFCTIENALTTDDYQEIYDMLSDSVKVSDYGKNLLDKARAVNE